MASGDRPKYQTIGDDLRQRLSDGEFAPGERLPAQHALATDYGVTVMTLRQALADLEAHGLVYAAKGKGTFVSEPPSVRYDLDHLSSFAQEMTEQGVEVATEVLSVDKIGNESRSAEARAALALDDDASLTELVRRRSVDGIPIVLQRSVMASEIWSTIESVDLTSTSLYGAVAERCGIELERASETIRAVGLGASDARVLGVATGKAVLESIRISIAADGAAFLYDRALLIGSATEIRAERSAAGTRVAFQANL